MIYTAAGYIPLQLHVRANDAYYKQFQAARIRRCLIYRAARRGWIYESGRRVSVRGVIAFLDATYGTLILYCIGAINQSAIADKSVSIIGWIHLRDDIGLRRDSLSRDVVNLYRNVL